jgi:hypothetical protein
MSLCCACPAPRDQAADPRAIGTKARHRDFKATATKRRITMRKALAIGLLALGTALAAPLAASAQSVEIGPRGFRVDPNEDGRPRYREEYRERRGDTINEREATSIARGAGVDRVRRVSGGYGRDWRVVGEDRFGREIRVVIDDRTGRILARDRD